MKQNYFLFFVALGIVALFNSCKDVDDKVKTDETDETIPANSLVYPSIPIDSIPIYPDTKIRNNQIVVDLGGLEIDFDTIIPNVIVESCSCGNPDIKLLTLPDDLDLETAVATVRESDDSRVKADKNFEFGFPILDEHGVYSITDAIVNANSLDLGFIDVLDALPDNADPVIAIVDSGIFPNAFQKNEITLFRSSVVCDPNTAGWNFVDNNDDLGDDIMHGTFVAKRIAKRVKELDVLAQTTTNYKILPLKVFSNGRGEYFDVVCAFSYIQQLINEEHVQIPIINASFGSSLGNLPLTDLLVLKKYIDDLNKSTIIVASAGNEGEDNGAIPHFPSGYNHNTSLMNASITPSNNIVAVAGYVPIDTDQQVQLAPKTTVDPLIGSNFGELNVDLAAPWAFQMEETKENGQTIVVTGLQGTSYSAAYVSGDLLYFLANEAGGIAPQNPIQGLLDGYYSIGRINMTNNIQVIDGKYVE